MEQLLGESNLSFFEELFETLDKDSSGELDLEEIELAINSTAEGTADAAYLMGIADTNRSGGLDINEFMFLFLLAQEPKRQLEELLEIFEKYDTDNDNELDLEESYACMNAYSITKNGVKIIADEDEFREHFVTMDLDKNQLLNRPEFLIMYLGLSTKKFN